MRRSKFLLALCSGLLLIPSLALAEDGRPARIVTPEPPVHHSEPSVSPSASSTTLPEAEPGNDDSHEPIHVQVRTPLPQEFCTNLTAVNSAINTTTLSRFDQLRGNFSTRGSQVKTDLSGLAQKLVAARAAADAKRVQAFANLTAKATTPAQTAAITAFESQVNEAVTTERAAVDAADATFEQGVLAAITARQNQLSTGAAAYKIAVVAALAAAQASCTSGTDPATVRTTLQTALQTARANLQTAITAAGKRGPDLTSLRTTRDAAVKAAQAAFKTTVSQALTTLKAALGTSGNVTPTPTPSPTITP